MLLKARAFNIVESLLKRLDQMPRDDEEPLLCGLYAQLELAWCRDESTRNNIENLVQLTLPVSPKHKQAQKWINILSEATGKLEWEVKEKKSKVSGFWHRKTEHSNLKLDMFKGSLPVTEIPKNLLEDAWESCQKAKLFYADAAIARHYGFPGRLDIIRLSGDILDMENCYVNLAIIESSTATNIAGASSQTPKQQLSEFSIKQRLKVENVATKKEVDLPRLFDERQVKNHTIVPRRILIRGRAGVGKPTLCKKIVHDFLRSKIWTKRFNRILWIPLRRLREGIDPEVYIHRQFLSQHSEERIYTKALKSDIWEETSKNRTLFLLDGLDEVSRDTTERGVSIPTQIVTLLSQPNVLVPSRPYDLNLRGIRSFDLEMEAVGFRPGQVKAYLSNVGTDENELRRMEAFIQDHWLIQGLV
ncbi:hypothetical protein BO71DRAFT_432894 [Aspergillus ellipticus CBS 707.79]|uniref:NACHT domain-containing protein n=1 Tax=Aspergillus ellipticus CBS 707.79 TaxID=1448320 RepID=A0A319D1J3_9EURO|nr:hypothetical protein BO71DRAFT_432894 [Aspergillus ellipticus CBS 707.79]